MIRPVYSWPTPATTSTALPSAESSSKLNRSALNFLSTIRVSEEETSKNQEKSAILLPIQESKGEKVIIPVVPGHIDSGWGIRMRGDTHAKYAKPETIRTDKPHRLFLSWDRAYPAVVLSLVLPEKSSAASTKKAVKSSTLEPPQDDSKRDDSIEEDEREITHQHHHHNDSSSDSEGQHHKTNGRGKSYAFLLKRNRSFPAFKRRLTKAGSPSLMSATLAALEDKHQDTKESPPAQSGRRRKLNLLGGEDDQDHERDAREREDNAWDTEYNIDMLDDSKIIQGKHRVVQNLPSIRVSIIPYIKTKVLKEELNSVFREQHPEIADDLTLSMLRRLKREMLERAKSADIELCTVALAYVYFEKLVLKRVVHKANRKVIAYACLVIAYKYNESGADKLHHLLNEIERVNGVSSSDIFAVEFAVFAHLKFNLMVPGVDYYEHFVRLLRAVDVAPSEYLGESRDEVAALMKTLALQDKLYDEEDSESDSDSSSREDDDDDRDRIGGDKKG